MPNISPIQTVYKQYFNYDDKSAVIFYKILLHFSIERLEYHFLVIAELEIGE